MMDWAGIKGVTTPLFAQLCGLPLAQVRWFDEDAGSTWTDDPHLELTLSMERSIGVDEERRDDSADGDLPANPDALPPSTNDGIVTVCGPRMFTLTVACESQTGDIADPRNGAAILSKLRTRLSRQSTVEALTDFYAVSDWQDIKRVPYRDKDGRLVNRYVLDLICLTADNDTDDTQQAGAWIGEVQGTGTVNVDGRAPLTISYDVKEE